MKYRIATISFILLFMVGIIFLTFFYGPLRRNYLTPSRVELAASTSDVNRFWETSGVKGRAAVLLTRYLNAEESATLVDNVKFVDLGMKHGIVRTVYHVVPDGVWQTVSDNLSHRDNVRVTPVGFIMIQPEGRVHILPLSRFKPPSEKMLLVVEPGVWNSNELVRIEDLMRKGDLNTDSVTIIRGTITYLDRLKLLVRK